ncbi:MAG: carboxyl transferase domain-containing protein [Acidimicrobiales bacterium]
MTTDTVDIRARASGFVRAKSSDFHGRRVILVDAEGDDLAGALTPSDGHTIAAAARYALDQRLPLVIRLASSGANLNEGVAALDGWGGAAREMSRCSGVVPLICIVSGPTVSGPALMLGLADIVVMVQGAYAFVSGPTMVEQFTGVPIDNDELGGVAVHARTSGVATLIADDMASAELLAAEILSFLPDHTDDAAPTRPAPTRSSGPRPRPTRCSPSRRTGPTTAATSSPRSSTTATCSSCTPTGRPTW